MMPDPDAVFPDALLTPSEMSEADRLTIAGGLSGVALMEHAGAALFDALRRAYPGARRVAVLAGPGNNGGDAYVAARLLVAEAGLDVVLFASVSAERLAGDAAVAAARYCGPSEPIGAFDPQGFDLIVDGIYGAGLSRPPRGLEAAAIRAANGSGLPILAIDLPSGVSGLDGTAYDPAIRAELTVTFFRRKPGHLLQPGRTHCGCVEVAEIGIDGAVLSDIAPKTFANGRALWRASFPRPGIAGHKFDRGHAVVFSGSAVKTGAARLSAMAALRAGAGLVTLASPSSALLVNASHLTAIMLARCEIPADLDSLLADERLDAFVLGPGFGIGERACQAAEAVLRAGRSLVLDADGITSFTETPGRLFENVGSSRGGVVLTPHAGEFRRLFPDLAGDGTLSKLDRARAAAHRSGAVLVLKGSDTVVAEPDGRAAISETGTPFLATAGSGDVLSGLVAGLLAQGMPAFEAAAAAVWMHGRAAELFGPGLIAEDLPGLIPRVLADILA